MATKQMTFHESYGELPKWLLRRIRKHDVTPAEFQDFEYAGMTFAEMEQAIIDHSPNGYFSHFSWMSERFDW